MTQEVSNVLFPLGQALIWASAASLFVVSIAAIGMVAWAGTRATGVRLPVSFQLIIGIGLLELIFIGWGFSQAERPLREAFIWLLCGCCAACALMALVTPQRTKSAIADFAAHAQQHWPMAVHFLSYLILVSWVMTSSFTENDINAVTTGNADIYYYAKLADFLLNEGGGAGNIIGFNLRQISHSDVFGDFVVLAWVSFIFNDYAINVSIAPMAAACALIAAAISWICRSAMRLPWTLSFGLGLLPLSTHLFWYVALNYFLSQVLGSATLLMAVSLLLSLASAKQFNLRIALIAGAVFLNCLLFIYWVLLFPNLLFLGALVGWLMFATSVRKPLRSFLSKDLTAAILSGLAVAAVASLIMIMITRDRYLSAIQLFILYGQGAVTGWPSGFISPASMFGAPLTWRATLDERGIVELASLMSILIFAAFLILRRSYDIRRKLLDLVPLSLSGLFLVLYVVVWLRYGHSYVQWKFAGFYPLMFAFGLAASLAAGLIQLTKLRHRVRTANIIAALVLCLAGYNIYAFVAPLRINVLHRPHTIESVAEIDTMAEVAHVFIDLPDFYSRMLAADFIRQKNISFMGPTYFGEGVAAPTVPSESTPILRYSPNPPDRSIFKALGGGYYLATY